MQQPIQLEAASRTDRGVHALGQVVNFVADLKNLSLTRLQIGVNALLPEDLRVVDASLAPSDFHPTLHSTGKKYAYWICNTPFQLPQHRNFSWHYPYPLDLELMQIAAQYLEGTHDFTSFTNRRTPPHSDCTRTIEKIEMSVEPDQRLCLKVTGNNFLYKMVRNLIGTLLLVGRKKIGVDQVIDILQSGDRSQAGMTAPAKGLTLIEVFYDRT